MIRRRKYQLAWGAHRLELGRRTCIMGIVNVTPDSFSDGGKFYRRDAAAAQGEKMAAEGADIIDVGGESTRPFSQPVSVEEEIRRVVPVIERLALRVAVPISIDTTKAEVARRAVEAGASMINDVSALRFDADLGEVAARSGLPVILMHMLREPGSMQVKPHYDDLLGQIAQFLSAAMRRAEERGIARSKIIVDPGIGFGKTVTHNLLLLKHLPAFADLDVPLLIGASRKFFIRQILKTGEQQDLPPDLPIVETGSQAAVAAAVINGAHIVRVHEVANTLATVKIIDAILNAR